MTYVRVCIACYPYRLSKKSRYPEEAKLHLEQWIVANLTDPYPTEEVKISLSEETGGDIVLITITTDSYLSSNRADVYRILPPLIAFFRSYEATG